MDGSPPKEYIFLCAIAFLSILSGSFVNPLLSIYARRLGASGVLIGLVVAAYWTARVFLEIPSGLLSSRRGYFPPMILGLSLITLGNLLCRFVRSPYELMVARAMVGMGAPLFYAVAMTFVVDLFTAERRGSAMGFFQGVEFLGTILGSSLSGYIVSLLGFRDAFLLSSTLGTTAIGLLALSGIRAKRRDLEAGSVNLSSIAEVLRSRNLLIVSSSIFAEFVMSVGVLYTIFPLHLNEGLSLPLTLIGLILAARSIGFVSSMFTMGPISDRVGRRPVLLAGLAATCGIVLVLGYLRSPPLLALAVFSIGVSTGAIWIVSPVIASESVRPELRGAAIGAYRTFFDLGSIFGPVMMSTMNEAWGIKACFYAASLIILVNVPLALLLRERVTSSAS
ncbi:MAG: arabinose efflux permease family protein [Candidatus Bathyarchaeota archaeon B23]|nr:MAG: arabinose efflux permease family protein [Candidatus Bathyarchaeota archaeon B23]